MNVPPDTIQIGQCYFMVTGQVRRVLRIMADGRVQYEYRPAHRIGPKAWQSGMQSGRSFADLVERLVLCDWTLDSDEGSHAQSRG
jgi:hypothetical protein